MNADTIVIEVPKVHYTLFNNKRDGKPEIIVVNDALLAFPHIDVFPWHLYVELQVRELADNGMPTHNESQLLFRIGDRIERTVLGGRTEFGGENALFLARSTWNAIRELHFQVHNPDIADGALHELLEAETWQRDWEYVMKHDPKWTRAAEMFQLFPLAKGADA
ncbi:MAG: DUF695 domain-containing protein [Steroidobacteraceae bacterium]